MNVKDLLTKARDLIVTKGWCQNASARNADGKGVTMDDQGACSFCAIAALVKSAPRDEEGGANVAIARRAVAVAAFGEVEGLVDWNDTPGRTKEQVIAAFDRAIEAQA